VRSSCCLLCAPLVLPPVCLSELSLLLRAGAREIHALFDDGRVYKVTPVAADAESDIAIGRIVAPAGTKFKPLRIGRAAALRRGDILVVLGAPLGGSLVPTVGSLSGARYVGDDEIMSYVLNSRTDWNLLACDASFSSGTSGGPVVNADGEVVGVAVMVRTAGNPMEVRCVGLRGAARSASEQVRAGCGRGQEGNDLGTCCGAMAAAVRVPGYAGARVAARRA